MERVEIVWERAINRWTKSNRFRELEVRKESV